MSDVRSLLRPYRHISRPGDISLLTQQAVNHALARQSGYEIPLAFDWLEQGSGLDRSPARIPRPAGRRGPAARIGRVCSQPPIDSPVIAALRCSSSSSARTPMFSCTSRTGLAHASAQMRLSPSCSIPIANPPNRWPDGMILSPVTASRPHH